MRLVTICSVATTIALAGCVPNPATDVAASGETLKVQYSSGTGSYVSNDVVSTTVHKDADGKEVGSSDTYQPVEHSYQWNDWKYFQGREELDEQDFYRIAGDQEAADKIAGIRASASKKMKVGATVAAAGIVAGLVFAGLGQSRDNASFNTLGYSLGTAVGTGGLLVWYWGSNEMKKPHHLPSSRADQNADVVEDCNEGRCTRARGGHNRKVGER